MGGVVGLPPLAGEMSEGQRGRGCEATPGDVRVGRTGHLTFANPANTGIRVRGGSVTRPCRQWETPCYLFTT